MEEEDTHYCLKCRAIITGLDNYVNHRKTRCGAAAPSDPSELKADDFFSVLELRSGPNPPATTPPLPDKPLYNLSKDDQSEADEDDEDEDEPGHIGGKWKPGQGPPTGQFGGKWKPGQGPPPSHSGGKWKPTPEPPTHFGGKWKPGLGPPPDHCGGKWRPNLLEQTQQDDDDDAPPPTSTGGKWLPGKRGASVRFWCNACERALKTRAAYEKHLLSELHFKRTSRRQQAVRLTKRRVAAKIRENTPSPTPPVRPEPPKKRAKRQPKILETPAEKPLPAYILCEVCGAKVARHLMGKHMVSLYHWTKSKGKPVYQQVLENIHSVVRQSPFQCHVCRFYCNSHEALLLHWASDMHREADSKAHGDYWCSFCQWTGSTSDAAADHMSSSLHLDMTAMMNMSMPMIIRKAVFPACGSCGRRFRTHAELLRHAAALSHQVPDSTRLARADFSCTHCPKRGFRTRKKLQMHMRLSHRDAVKEPYFCGACDLRFPSAHDALQHRASPEHRKRADAIRLGAHALLKACPHCGQVQDDVDALKRHIKTDHQEKILGCTSCGMKFSLPQELTLHVRKKMCIVQKEDDSLSGNKCKECPYKHPLKAEVIYHEIVHHGQPETVTYNTDTGAHQVAMYQCGTCKKLFRRTGLRSHLRQHTGERPYLCDCGRAFALRSTLAEHRRREHGAADATLRVARPPNPDKPKDFICALCNAAFYTKQALGMHTQVHAGKAVGCAWPGCVFRCRSHAELRAHGATHADARPFRCAACPYAAKTRAQLHRHSSIHRGERGHQCPHCPFAARLSSHLRRHLRLHTGAKPYKCPYCSYTCNILENLRKHVLHTGKHPGKRLYECRFCAGAFACNLATELRAHLVTAHADVFSTPALATSYVAGIYDVRRDPRHVDHPLPVKPKPPRRKPAEVATAPNSVPVMMVDQEKEVIYIEVPADAEQTFLLPELFSVDDQVLICQTAETSGEAHTLTSPPELDCKADAANSDPTEEYLVIYN